MIQNSNSIEQKYFNSPTSEIEFEQEKLELKKIYFLYSCLTSILTNSYLQKFCILTSGPSLIIRVVRFIAIRALKIMYFLLLQYSESEMFCYTEVVKMSWYCLHIAAPLVDSQSCSTSVIGGSFEAQLLKFYDENLPFLPFSQHMSAWIKKIETYFQIKDK